MINFSLTTSLEYRLHAIVFTLRGFGAFVFSTYRPFEGHWVEHVMLYGVYLMFHSVVDEISRRHGSKEHSTVRVKDNNRFFSTLALRFYSFYQFCAVGCLNTPSARLGDMGTFLCLFKNNVVVLMRQLRLIMN